jgi:uncharacterized protein with HEPN domain
VHPCQSARFGVDPRRRGEPHARLPYLKEHRPIPWREITGIRHKLIHDYFVVDLGIVWRTATVNVPQVGPLVKAAAALLDVAHPPDNGPR